MKELTLIDKAFLLKKNALFTSIDIDFLLTIGDNLETEFYKHGSKVFEVDQAAGRIYLVAVGKLAVHNKAGQILATLNPYDLFGDEALLSEKKRGYSVLCLTDSTLLSLSKSHFFAILGEFPSVALSLLQSYSNLIDFRKK